MQRAFTTLACPGWTLEQAADAAQRYGYDGLELRLLDGELLRADLDAATRRRVRDVCADAGLPIVCVDTSVALAQPDASARQRQIDEGLAFLELAAAWGAPLIRVFGAPPDGLDADTAVAASVETLVPLAERAAALGLSVALETHDAFSSSALVARVLAQVPSPAAGALWDLLHPYRVGEHPAETLERLAGRLLHVHIKDGRRPTAPDGRWELTLLGQGDVPTGAILGALRATDYRGWLAVEWEKKWHPQLAEPEIALPQHLEALEELGVRG